MPPGRRFKAGERFKNGRNHERNQEQSDRGYFMRRGRGQQEPRYTDTPNWSRGSSRRGARNEHSLKVRYGRQHEAGKHSSSRRSWRNQEKGESSSRTESPSSQTQSTCGILLDRYK